MLITGTVVLLTVLGIISSIAGVVALVWFMNKVQARRRELSNVGFAFAKWGFKKIAEVLSYLGSGDVGGAGAKLRSLSMMLREAESEDKRDAMILEWTREAWLIALPSRLQDEECIAAMRNALASADTPDYPAVG